MKRTLMFLTLQWSFKKEECVFFSGVNVEGFELNTKCQRWGSVAMTSIRTSAHSDCTNQQNALSGKTPDWTTIKPLDWRKYTLKQRVKVQLALIMCLQPGMDGETVKSSRWIKQVLTLILTAINKLLDLFGAQQISSSHTLNLYE